VPAPQEPDGSGGPRRDLPRSQEPATAPHLTLGDFARRVLVVLLLVGLAYLLWRGVGVLLQAFAGVLLAVFLSALATRLRDRTGLAYGWSLAVVVVVVVVVTVGVGLLLANRLAAQLGQLDVQLKQSWKEIGDSLGRYPAGKVLLEWMPGTSRSVAAQVIDVSRLTGLIAGVAGLLVTPLVILFVGIFGAAEPEVYRQGLLHLVPESERRRAEEVLDAVAVNLRWWLVGQVILMVMMGVTTAVGLWVIGVPLALSLGVIAGVLELVPYLGPWLSAIPAVLVALAVSPAHLAATVALYLVLHLLEGYVMLPLVQRRAVHLPPALTLLTQVLLGELLGLLGLFVAAPLTLCAVVVLKMLYVKDTLGDRGGEVAGEVGEGELVPAPDATEGRRG
jgi:predicted PurR-regulated permease PerM